MDSIEGCGRFACVQPARSKSVWRSLRNASLVGVLLSSLAAFVCILFGGAGHGANSPFFVYFGPILAYWQVGEYDADSAARYLGLTIAITFLLYSVYAMVISLGRLIGHGRSALTLVLLLHYCGVGVCVLSDDWDGTRNIWIISEIYGGWITVLLVEMFVALHLLAFQYAWSEIPYRPVFTRRINVILGLGLVAGIAFHVLTAMQAR